MKKPHMIEIDKKIEKRENKFKDYSFEELMELTIPQVFYKEVTSKDDLKDFIIMLHRTRCKDLGIRYLKVFFENFQYDKYGECGTNSINITRNFLRIFQTCKEENNLYFPFVIAITILHETRHHWQHEMETDLNNKNFSLIEKLSIASGMRFSDKNVELGDIWSSYQYEKNICLSKMYCNQAIRHIENIDKEYSNSPHELDAENDAIGVLKKLYLKTKDKNVKIAERNIVEDILYSYDDGKWNVENILKEEYLSDDARNVFKEFNNYLNQNNLKDIKGNYLLHMYKNISNDIMGNDNILSNKELKHINRFFNIYDRCLRYNNDRYKN